MSLFAFGINHKTAPVNIRERLAFAPDQLGDALRQLLNHTPIKEAAILSTCNRTEIYCEGDTHNPEAAIDWLSTYHQFSKGELSPYLYTHPDQEAVRHILRVASGLDSLILGEPQILGQLKNAYTTANDAGTLGTALGRLFQHTFSVAKQIRTDTAIGSSPVSIAFAAVSLAKQIFGQLDQYVCLLIGAGATIELAARHLKDNGIKQLIVANRTLERAQVLALELNAQAITLAEIPALLPQADIVISSTASPLPILGKGTVERAIKIRKHRPMFMVDIAIPRDIEPEVGDLADIYLYNVDDLQEVIQENLKSRQEAAKQAEEIIDAQVTHFMGWLRSLSAVDTIRAYRNKAEKFQQLEMEKALKMLAKGEDPQKVLQHFAHGLTNKLLHTPSTTLKQAGFEGQTQLLAVFRKLFDLKDND